MDLEIGNYKITLDGKLEKNSYSGDITVSLGSDTKHYEDVIFYDISCILEGHEKLREAYAMGILEDLENGRRIFDEKWRNGFCLFRYFSEVCELRK